MFLNAVRGFCMALADSVPGVSGGTIAFLLGFYDEFINSLNDMIGKDNAKRKAALVFLIKLGIGWVIGFGASVMVLSSLFQVHIYEISSVFLGLTLFAIPLVVKDPKPTPIFHPKRSSGPATTGPSFSIRRPLRAMYVLRPI